MAFSDARSTQAKVKRYAVYVRRIVTGAEQLVRRSYDVVEYNWGNGEIKFYLQPIHRGISPTLDEDVYDGIRIYDKAPDWDNTVLR